MIEGIVSILSQRPFPLATESQTQVAISAVLTEAGIEHAREVRLNDADRIDFVVSGSIGLEIKIKGSRMDIWRQMSRYAKHRELSALILATNVPMGFPPEIDGMPVYVVNLAKAWL